MGLRRLSCMIAMILALAHPAPAWAQGAPGSVDSVPVDSGPVDSVPVDSAPVDSAPVEAGPDEGTAQEPVRIGILAHRGWTGIEREWAPFRAYATDALGAPVRLVPVTLASAGPLIDNGALDFLITNPGHYVALEKTRPMSVLATLERQLSDGSFGSDFGSAIFVAAGSDIHTLEDAAGRRVAAVDPRAFGGFQVAWRAFKDRGIDPFREFEALAFVGFPQDQIIERVLSGQSDIGIVRSGLIEALAAEGGLDPGRLRVLNRNASFTHPDAVSTRLYPEWPFLAPSKTPGALRDRMALALLETQHPDIRAAYGLADRWGAPLSYHAVRALDAAFAAAGHAPAQIGGRQSPRGTALPGALVLAALLLAIAGAALLRMRRRGPPPRSTAPGAPAPAAAAPGAAAQPEVRPKVRPEVRPEVAPEAQPEARPEVQLTRREREILDLVSRGRSSKEIARTLGISPKTVEFHRANLLRKHGARSAVDLVRKAAATADSTQT